MSLINSVKEISILFLSWFSGSILGFCLSGLALLRKNKPIHTNGQIFTGIWSIQQSAGIQSKIFDQVQEEKIICRLSRSLSIGTQYDVMGIALRFHYENSKNKIDLLFVTTGEGKISKYLPKFEKNMGKGTYTTILPMKYFNGKIWFRLKEVSEKIYSIAYRINGEDWIVIGELRIHPEPFIDQAIRFDPISSLPDGLSLDPWVRALRAPSYRLSRKVIHLG